MTKRAVADELGAGFITETSTGRKLSVFVVIDKKTGLLAAKIHCMLHYKGTAAVDVFDWSQALMDAPADISRGTSAKGSIAEALSQCRFKGRQIPTTGGEDERGRIYTHWQQYIEAQGYRVICAFAGIRSRRYELGGAYLAD